MLAELHKTLAPLKQRILMMVGRALILAVKTEGVLPQLTAELMQGEVLENLPLMQQFGFASHPLPGAEGVALFQAGDRSSGVVVACEDRRVRPALEPGEAALYSAQDVLHPDDETPEGYEAGDPLHRIQLKDGRIILINGDSAAADIKGAASVAATLCSMILDGTQLSFSSDGEFVTISAPVPIVLNTTVHQPPGGGGSSRPAELTLSADTVKIDADTLEIKLGSKTFTYTASGMPARIGADSAGGDTIQEG